MSDSIGFGKYELIERIALGGMAEIFRARSASLGGLTRNCVIKRILPEYSQDRNFVSMFIDEARITIGLDHPHIVRLFDFGQVDGTYYMAMEYVDGCDLVDLLRSFKRMEMTLPPQAAAYVAKSMCLGLHHAHVQKDHRGVALGVVHRDVSPHNVFLSGAGDVKVGDFGIASAKNKTTQTQAGTVKGKFAYMSPEQTCGQGVDARSDLWAVGVVLHEMLSGARLFACDNPILTIGRVNEMEVGPPSEKNPGVPVGLDDIVLHSLQRDIQERYQNGKEMAAALDDWLKKSGGYSRQDFANFIAEHLDEEPTGPAFLASQHMSQERTPSLTDPSNRPQDAEVAKLLARLTQEPSLWTLVQIGEFYLDKGDLELGLSALRTASAIFSSRGMLVQAICAHYPARAFLDDTEILFDLRTFSELRENDRDKLNAALEEFDRGGFNKILQAATQQNDDDECTSVLHPAPLFGRMAPAEFARLALAASVFSAPVGTLLVNEGERSKSLFAIGRGRSVVHCKPGAPEEYFGSSAEGEAIGSSERAVDNRIYLSALADGDFFGEFSFLTQRPRSASVEAITDSIILQLDEEACENILQRDPAFSEPLLEFYKERVGELMMAKNPVFALLSSEDRRELLMRSQLRTYSDEEIVLKQGDVSEEMYFIKNGEVEVFRSDDGLPVFINKLREGEFFGEMAAIHGTPRTASIRAMGEVELFCFRRSELEAILSREDEVRILFEAAIKSRAEETSERMAESRRIFQGI